MGRFNILLALVAATVIAGGCSQQKQNADKVLDSVESSLAAIRSDAEHYAPDGLKSVDAQLARLKASYENKDYNDVIAGTPQLRKAVDSLENAVKSGKVREIGCSNFSAEQLREAEKAAAGRARFVSVQNEYSLLQREPEKEVLAELLPANRHFQQDATAFDLPEHRFDLIVCNEVIADFLQREIRQLPDQISGTLAWQDQSRLSRLGSQIGQRDLELPRDTLGDLSRRDVALPRGPGVDVRV